MDLYKDILRPIADLAQNFNINLSDFLQRYVSRLRRNSINESLVNFAHAGLVLQNSSDIYGRKVDFLYQSVLQLIELINSSHSTSKDVQTDGKEPEKVRTPRRRRTTTIVPMEDFNSIECIPSDKQLTIAIHNSTFKSKKKWKLSTLGTFVCEKAQKSQSNPVFDQNLECMGQLSDFRLSWFFGADFTLEESLQERRGGNISIFEARVSNMPTPEYSDEGGITDHALMTSLGSEANVASEPIAEPEPIAVPEPIVVPEVNIIPDNVETHSSEIEMRLGSSINQEKQVPDKKAHQKQKDVTELKTEKKWTMNNDYLKFEDRPQHPKRVFALPPELRLKRKERPLFAMTKFLMSDVLKRQLRIEGVDPEIVANKVEEEKCIKKLIQRQIKLYNLDRRPKYNVQSLREEQGEFLGFDERDTCRDSTGDDNDFAAIPTPPLSRSASPASPAAREGTDDEGGVYEDAVASEMAAYHAKKNAQQTNTSVVEWHRSLKDKLENASKNSTFDVHEYGSQILNKFDKTGMEMPFRELAKGHASSEVGRYFVSVLMLANTGNLELAENGPDTLKLKLLSRKRQHDMEKFLVPSALPRSQSEEMDESPGQSPSKRRKANELHLARQPSPQPEVSPTCIRVPEKSRNCIPVPEISPSCVRVPVICFAPHSSPLPGPSGLPPPFPDESSESELSHSRLDSSQGEEFSTCDTHTRVLFRTPSPLPGPSGLLPPRSESQNTIVERQYERCLDDTPKRSLKQVKGTGPWKVKSKK